MIFSMICYTGQHSMIPSKMSNQRDWADGFPDNNMLGSALSLRVDFECRIPVPRYAGYGITPCLHIDCFSRGSEEWHDIEDS